MPSASDPTQAQTNADQKTTNADQRVTNAEQNATNAEQNVTNAGQFATNAEQNTTNANAVTRMDESDNSIREMRQEIRDFASNPQGSLSPSQSATNAKQTRTNADQRVTNVEQDATNAEQHTTNAEQHATNAGNVLRMDKSEFNNGEMRIAIEEITGSLDSVIKGQHKVIQSFEAVNTKSDRRAKVFRRLWATLAVLAVFVSGTTFLLNADRRNFDCNAANTVTQSQNALLQRIHDLRVAANPNDAIAAEQQAFLDTNTIVVCR
jgi:hypothetical protein